MTFGSFDGGEDGEHNGVSLVRISVVYVHDFPEELYHLTELSEVLDNMALVDD